MASGSTINEKKWISDSTQYLAVEYDDTHLVYFKPSGETHFLNFLSFGLVDVASNGPLSTAELFEALKSRFSLTVDELPVDLITSTLAELDQAGLVTSVDARI